MRWQGLHPAPVAGRKESPGFFFTSRDAVGKGVEKNGGGAPGCIWRAWSHVCSAHIKQHVFASVACWPRNVRERRCESRASTSGACLWPNPAEMRIWGLLSLQTLTTLTLIMTLKTTYGASFSHQKALPAEAFGCTSTPLGSLYATPHTTGLFGGSSGAFPPAF